MNLRREGGTPPYIFCLLGNVGRHTLMPARAATRKYFRIPSVQTRPNVL